MPLIMRRCGSFGCPVQGFSGGRCGSSRRHCASAKSPRLTYPMWELRPETSGVCRHALGSTEALRRLATVFAAGTAVREIKRRKDRRVRRGEESERAQQGVVMELSDEICNGVGLGMILRSSDNLAMAAE